MAKSRLQARPVLQYLLLGHKWHLVSEGEDFLELEFGFFAHEFVDFNHRAGILGTS